MYWVFYRCEEFMDLCRRRHKPGMWIADFFSITFCLYNIDPCELDVCVEKKLNIGKNKWKEEKVKIRWKPERRQWIERWMSGSGKDEKNYDHQTVFSSSWRLSSGSGAAVFRKPQASCEISRWRSAEVSMWRSVISSPAAEILKLSVNVTIVRCGGTVPVFRIENQSLLASGTLPQNTRHGQTLILSRPESPFPHADRLTSARLPLQRQWGHPIAPL